METYTSLVAKLRNADSGWEISGPQPKSRVAEVEEHLNILLPESYKRYLTDVGAMAYSDLVFDGLDDNYLHPDFGFGRLTRSLQKARSLPSGLFVLEFDQDMDEIACLDLNSMSDGECVVVWFDVHSNAVETSPYGNFDEYFRDTIRKWLAGANAA